MSNEIGAQAGSKKVGISVKSLQSNAVPVVVVVSAFVFLLALSIQLFDVPSVWLVGGGISTLIAVIVAAALG
jgi:hypothetical protein